MSINTHTVPVQRCSLIEIFSQASESHKAFEFFFPKSKPQSNPG